MHSLYKILHFHVVNLHHFATGNFRFMLNSVIWTTLNHFYPFFDGLFSNKTKLNPIPQAIFSVNSSYTLPSIHETHIIYIRYPRKERLPAIHHDRRSLPQNAISASKPTNKSAKDKQNLLVAIIQWCTWPSMSNCECKHVYPKPTNKKEK